MDDIVCFELLYDFGFEGLFFYVIEIKMSNFLLKGLKTRYRFIGGFGTMLILKYILNRKTFLNFLLYIQTLIIISSVGET